MVVVSTAKGKIFTSRSGSKKKKKISVILPEELIIYEILTRLPINQLLRLKLVCKKWHSSIPSDPLFVTYHFHNNGTKNLSSSGSFYYFHLGKRVISSSNDRYQFKLPKPNKYVDRYGFVVGSISGLLYGFCDYFEIFVCNPMTKHVVHIPNPKQANFIALAYDPYNNPNFGFAIIAMVYIQEVPSYFQFEVYSSKTGKWRVSKNAKLTVALCQHLRDKGAVYHGGKVYWSLVRHMVWFDVEEGAAGIVPFPNHDDNYFFRDPFEDVSYFEIGLCNENGGGQLSYSNMTEEGDMEIWLLRNNNKERKRGNHQCYDEFDWVKRYSVNLRGWDFVTKYCRTMEMWLFAKVFARSRTIIYPLPYLGGQVLWFWMEIKSKGKLFSINLRTQELKLINHDDIPLPAWPFVPTLLPCPT